MSDLPILPAGDPAPWQALAACQGVDPDLFFPERGASVREPKAVCARCPVAADCLEHALTHHEVHGIWGGKSERERRSMRRQRARSASDARIISFGGVA